MKVIILCGLPGSGKSTLCKNHFSSYDRINQDELGTRQKCIDVMHSALERRRNIIIDRVNSTAKQRKYWLDLALEYGADSVTCIYLDVAEEECLARIHERKDHETIKADFALETKRNIIYQFNRDFEMPKLEEGFSTVVITRN